MAWILLKIFKIWFCLLICFQCLYLSWLFFKLSQSGVPNSSTNFNAWLSRLLWSDHSTHLNFPIHKIGMCIAHITLELCSIPNRQGILVPLVNTRLWSPLCLQYNFLWGDLDNFRATPLKTFEFLYSFSSAYFECFASVMSDTLQPCGL